MTGREMLIFFGSFFVGMVFVSGVVLAEPQFGGDVSGVIRCTCGDNAGGVYFMVGDPHGNESGGSESFVAPPGVEKDCASIQDGEETLGMHTGEDTECEIQVYNECVTIATGKKVDFFGTSPASCNTGLGGAASGEGEHNTNSGADGGGEPVPAGEGTGDGVGETMSSESGSGLGNAPSGSDSSDGTGHSPISESSDGEPRSTMPVKKGGNKAESSLPVGKNSKAKSFIPVKKGGGKADSSTPTSFGGTVTSSNPSVLGSMDRKVILKKDDEKKGDFEIGERVQLETSKNQKKLPVVILAITSFVGAGYLTFKSVRKVFK